MNADNLKSKLEQVFGVEFRYIQLGQKEWEAMRPEDGSGRWATKDDVLYFLVARRRGKVTALAVEDIFLNVSERRLIELLLETMDNAGSLQIHLPPAESEVRSAALRDWLREQIDRQAADRELPEGLAVSPALHESKLPILLHFPENSEQRNQTADLRQVLESYFAHDMILIPLYEREWIVLAPETLVAPQESDVDGEEETMEDAIESVVSGLQDMLSSEWFGECHLSAGYPMVPARSLLKTVRQLRETTYLGRKYQAGASVHLPWRVSLEKLLDPVPERDKLDFIERVLKKTDYFSDAEMMNTIEQFFQQGCNVSDTAKQLYIHRNTLLYRLDKFRHETGLDVRAFQDAVLVRLALLLYKVTKSP